jgi:hypothetical protein
MAISNPDRVVTKQDLANFYGEILPYLGGMPEVLANKFSKGDLYSTDEKIIGQWIDGKPLYQKVIRETITVSGSRAYFLSTTIPDAEFSFIYNASVYAYSDYIGSCSEVGSVNTSSQYDFNITDYTPATGRIWLIRGANAYQYLQLIVRYTKTTDSPISIGSDTDYSTTEKIVGTWINGKPIYQKVIACTKSSGYWQLLNSGQGVAISELQGNDIRYIISAYALSVATPTASWSAGKLAINLALENNVFKAWVAVGDVKANYIVIQYTKTTD